MFENYTREECRKIWFLKYMSKMTMPSKYVHKVDISGIYTRIKGPYILPVRYAHGQYGHTSSSKWMSMHLRTYWEFCDFLKLLRNEIQNTPCQLFLCPRRCAHKKGLWVNWAGSPLPRCMPMDNVTIFPDINRVYWRLSPSPHPNPVATIPG